MRKLLGGATEDLREPPNSFLMRYARDVVAVKDVGQAVFAGVCLVVDHLRRANVPPPSHNREQKEKCEDGCYNNRCQDLSSRARKSRCPSSQTRFRLDLKREGCSPAIIHNARRLIEISLAFRFGGCPTQCNGDRRPTFWSAARITSSPCFSQSCMRLAFIKKTAPDLTSGATA